MVDNFFILLLAHYILDYPMQGDFLASTKGKYHYSLFVHSAIYGLGMALAFKLLGFGGFIPIALITTGSHIVIDSIKANAKDKEKALTSYLYIDQGLHITINTILLIFFAIVG